MTNQNNKGPAAEAGHVGFAIHHLPKAARNQLPLSKEGHAGRALNALSNSMPGHQPG